MKHQSFYVDDSLFQDDNICATRTHKAILQDETQPLVDGSQYVWLKGEFCNRDDLARRVRLTMPPSSDPLLLLQLYRQDDSFSFLRQIDGIYSAVLYDANRKVVHLITDRYGLGYLYWATLGETFVWASEVKAFLAHPGFEPRINPETMADFFGSGYPQENRSWFEGVELVPPASVLSWDLRKKKLIRKIYWSWSDIGPRTEKADPAELVEEIGRLWLESVKKRSIARGKRVGITLSGGLESRAILAAIPQLDYPLHTVTVGNDYCHDVRIARRAAKLKGAQHHIAELNVRNWIDRRPAAVWWSDGQYDIKHMHGCAALDKISHLYDINLSGYIGGVIMGASYLSRFARDKEDEYRTINNRGRRFIGSHVMSIDDVFFDSRCPFVDNVLVELMMSIPDRVRLNHGIYKSMLLHVFPEFFRRIPWQKTGLPIESSSTRREIKAAYDSIKGLASRVVRKAGYDPARIAWFNSIQYHNYPFWLRQDPGRTFAERILRSEKALFPEFVDRKAVEEAWTSHMKGANKAATLCRYLTFEIWLQQVFAGNFRNGVEQSSDREGHRSVGSAFDESQPPRNGVQVDVKGPILV